MVHSLSISGWAFALKAPLSRSIVQFVCLARLVKQRHIGGEGPVGCGVTFMDVNYDRLRLVPRDSGILLKYLIRYDLLQIMLSP